METNELAKVDSPVEIQVTSMFSTKELFEHVQRVATMFSKSELVPKRYQNNIGNCVIALEMANRIGASPLMVMQNLYVILGNPGWSSKFLIGTLNACGKFSPLRYEEDDQDGGRTRAWAIDKKTGEKCYGAWVSMNMAKAEEWISKNGSKWKTMPELMRRYRAASFFTNQFAPEISMGLQTVEEIYDVIQPEPEKKDKEAERIELMISDATSPEQLEKIKAHVPEDQMNLFNSRLEELNAIEIDKMKGGK